MPFGEFLRSNNLPYIGERVRTPKGDRVEVVKYVFDAYDEYVKVRLIDSYDSVVEWTFDQIRQCKREEN